TGSAMRRMSWLDTMAACISGVVDRVMWVSTDPGARALTLMPSPANSAAIDRVMLISALLPATYIDRKAPVVNTPALITLTIEGCALRRRWGRALCTRNTGPRRLTSND